MADKRIAYKVDGEVQGVCFRDFTQQQAKKLGVKGFVQNASDGTVKGEAQGSETVLEEFVQHLNKGPRAARVTGVEQSDMEARQGERGFSVKY
ncbi:Acylphosphatase [Lophium mytilinum]|uniref:Acylphosphatase n=1 Tax=Lophium mytilinum TaxID=390894 RepID=A0A6A6QTQ8_9PEZI|nr:Acylphosphatase [Lophium mytilinum]